MKDLVWLDERDALTLHDRLLALHGGAVGVRDIGLLSSAIARPRQHFDYGNHPNVIQLAAVYTAAIVSNHPFVDGNKRTGFVIGILFLELNGFRFIASEEAAAQAVIALASGAMNEQGYTEFLSDNVNSF
jgi:death on curing protein